MISLFIPDVSEVSFSPNANPSSSSSEGGLSVTEYIVIAICSVLLGLIYVASVFLYLHLRKKKKDNDGALGRDNISNAEEGVVKSNPLLGLGRHFPINDNTFSDSGSSDNDAPPDLISHEERKKNVRKVI